jgi:hypothetical protein
MGALYAFKHSDIRLNCLRLTHTTTIESVVRLSDLAKAQGLRYNTVYGRS